MTTKFTNLKIFQNEISFNISNKWQLIDKDNVKYMRIKNSYLIDDWKTIFKSEPYITIMQETENKKQRVFILNKASILDVRQGDENVFSYKQGMVQHERNKPLIDLKTSYNINEGVICIHT